MSDITTRSRRDLGAGELADVRRRLAGTSGPQYWRGLEELAGSPEFEEYLHREFPSQADAWLDPVGRRRFLQVMGASLALAGVSGCVVRPEGKIVPYVKAPENLVPGRPSYYASAAVHDGYGFGVLVESHMGRPTKLEGNPDHPASRGATDAFAQASVLGLYDPDRSQAVAHNGRLSTWDDFLNALIDLRTELLGRRGAGLRFLTGTVTSPTVARLMGRLLGELFPEARWHQHEPAGNGNARAGATLAAGRPAEAVHHVDRADVIVSLDADFLGWGPSKLADARAFAARREPGGAPIRLYVAEPTPSITGAVADHRWPADAAQVAGLAVALAKAAGVAIDAPGHEPPGFRALADDLLKAKGRALVIAGETQPPAVHALAHAINAALDSVGADKPVTFHEPVAAVAAGEQGGTLAELADDIRNDRVQALVILGGNPAYDAPADLDFATLLGRVKTRVHLGLYADETARLCTWHVPEAHPLESWGDVRAFDGTAAVIQPLIAPLYGGHAAAEVLAALADGSPPPARELVEATWRGDRPAAEFAAAWRTILHDGLVPDSAAPALDVRPTLPAGLTLPAAAGDGYELAFRPDPSVWDGRYANNGWLQELPRPLTRLVWDNAALIAPATARTLGVADGDVLELSYGGRTLEVAALLVPGQAERTIALALGYGRKGEEFPGRVAAGAGFNAYALRRSDAPWGGAGLTVGKKAGATYELATVQMHHVMGGRDLVRTMTRAEFEHGSAEHGEGHEGEAPAGGHGGHHSEPDRELIIFEHPEPMARRIAGEGNRWGMSINLNTCIGCAACVVACQAENNIPVVGKEQVLRGREMHWLRIDRYWATKPDVSTPSGVRPELAATNPGVVFQPVLCMHCETAPCEIVCPVEATSHSAEGLNEMTYNRCVGTRYCSNNCPYKVRRFNFFGYADQETEVLKLQRNPDVSVRVRGVMEKCTYCVQRISAARIAAASADPTNGDPTVPGDAVVTACQQSCPTNAIVFGNLNYAKDPSDPEKNKPAVVRLKEERRSYSLLGELNTRPRTTYLARLTNPNPAIEA